MKNILLALLLLVNINIALSQTANSITNGNWTMPTTWDCMCVPTPGYTVNINHNVSLNTDFSYSSGTITIQTSGALTENQAGRFWVVNGGVLNVYGTLEVSNVSILAGQVNSYSNSELKVNSKFYSGGTFTNAGTVSLVDSFYVAGTLTNNGSIYVDKFSNAGYFYNNNHSTLGDYLNLGYFQNDGTFQITNFYNDMIGLNNGFMAFVDFTNDSIFDCYGQIQGLNHTNMGSFTLKSSGVMNLDIDFLNSDSVYHDAVFVIDGAMTVKNNMLNTDTLIGYGSICIGENTGNSGYIGETFTFCDNTPPPAYPYIDYNTGFVENTVNFCTSSCLVSVQTNEINNISLYPNPVKIGELISLENPNNNELDITIFDSMSKQISKISSNNTVINVSKIDISGIYFIVVNNGNTLITNKLIVE